MKILSTNNLTSIQRSAIRVLWNQEYPEKLTHHTLSDFENWLHKLKNPSHLLLVDHGGKIRGWYVDFDRDNKKWFAIILDARIQGKGYGRKLLDQAKEKEAVLNGWVIDHNTDRKRNGAIYRSPLSFYLKNGFKKVESDRLELNNISAIRILWEN